MTTPATLPPGAPAALPTAPAIVAPPAPTVAGPTTVALSAVGHRFGDVQALRDLTFQVPTGRITVLLGPNGAGKTTAIRVVTGALKPTEGRVVTFDRDPSADGENVRRRCGVVSAKPALYDRLSGWDNLRYSGELYEVQGDLDARIAEAAGRFGIAHALDHHVGGYSTGMKTRLALARSILHEPELLLFDEPTSGLDPESSVAVLEMIRHMTDEGHTVVMCTHLLAEAEGLADHVVVLDQGHALVEGAPDDLTRHYWPEPVVHFAAEKPAELDYLAGLPGVSTYHRGDDPASNRATVTLRDSGSVAELVELLVARGVRVTRVDPHEPTLEDLYFAVRGDQRGVTAPSIGGTEAR